MTEEKYYERLQEAWRAGRGDRSNQEIADAAGLAKSTVDYLFSVKSSDPKLSTAAAMSRELCASIDRAFNVVSAEEKREETELILETKLRAAERERERIGNTNILLCVLVLVMAARIILLDVAYLYDRMIAHAKIENGSLLPGKVALLPEVFNLRRREVCPYVYGCSLQ